MITDDEWTYYWKPLLAGPGGTFFWDQLFALPTVIRKLVLRHLGRMEIYVLWPDGRSSVERVTNRR